MTTRITIRKPDDWHLHVRDGEMLKAVLPHTARNFALAILMPNLIPPVRTTADCIAYRERVMAALPPGSKFKPLMTCYLTDDTEPDDVELVRDLLIQHAGYTGSRVAARLLGDWDAAIAKFVKVMPLDLRRALSEQKQKEAQRTPAPHDVLQTAEARGG